MNPFRAKRIADHFANVGIFEITNRLYGMEVHHRGQIAYFEDEKAFWQFLFCFAHAAHQDNIIAEAENELIVSCS